MARPTKSRLYAFKILAMLLYGNHSSATWVGNHALLRSNQFALATGTDPTRLRVLLFWLERYGYVANVETRWGFIEFDLVVPPRLQAIVDSRPYSANQEGTT